MLVVPIEQTGVEIEAEKAGETAKTIHHTRGMRAPHPAGHALKGFVVQIQIKAGGLVVESGGTGRGIAHTFKIGVKPSLGRPTCP